jgi:excisionase family DNA binding protein
VRAVAEERGEDGATRGGRRLLKIVDLADYLGVSVETIYKWRSSGYGPRGAKMGKHLRWKFEDVEAWYEEHRDDF